MKRICVLLVFTLAACSGYKQGVGDMQYMIHTDVPGEAIRTGDFLSVNYIHRTEEDSLLTSSYLLDHPVFFEQQQSSFKGDIFAGLSLLSEGDSATFRLNFDSMQIILNVPKPANTKGKYLVFTVKVEKVIPKAGKSDSLFSEEVRAFYAADAEKCRQEEEGKIHRYLSGNRLSPFETPSGLLYMVTSKGSGPVAAVGDSVSFEHTGMFITGKVFDSSMKDTALAAGIYDAQRPYSTNVIEAGAGATMPGVDEALLLLPAGTKARLLLPSRLAYGANGNSMFAPYMPLVFDIYIREVRKKGE
ncbi:FKBP-type peptidyl-prolyl cis-trans isomerase [uncultured Chitinophaga sp.]|uniref:FKBP-type peptidyl-prolyl cis-trans isomerase n=1 Tax=uncultured Chitinophaga sp. TaxID=339340 RepID=UPI0025E17C65|nr:FKBP-type peptidyl-prolyl cis-trans isomerase [uncultured Chitinophaga sp.]